MRLYTSARDLDCGSISWYTPAYSAFTKRDMGFDELKCTYYSIIGTFDSVTTFYLDPKMSMNATKAVAASQNAETPVPVVIQREPLKVGWCMLTVIITVPC